MREFVRKSRNEAGPSLVFRDPVAIAGDTDSICGANPSSQVAGSCGSGSIDDASLNRARDCSINLETDYRIHGIRSGTNQHRCSFPHWSLGRESTWEALLVAK